MPYSQITLGSSHLIHTPAHLLNFKGLQSAANAMGEKRDCAVIATAVITGLSYAEAHKQCKAAGRRDRCGTTYDIYKTVIENNGFKVHNISFMYDALSRSFRGLVPHLPTNHRFLMHTRKHVAAVVNGEIVDWSEHRKLHVDWLFLVLPANESPEYHGFHVGKDARPQDAARWAPAKPRTVVIDFDKPTRAVHIVADELYALEDTSDIPDHIIQRNWTSAFRAKVVAECERNDINKITATVQVGKWVKLKREVYFDRYKPIYYSPNTGNYKP